MINNVHKRDRYELVRLGPMSWEQYLLQMWTFGFDFDDIDKLSFEIYSIREKSVY